MSNPLDIDLDASKRKLVEDEDRFAQWKREDTQRRAEQDTAIALAVLREKNARAQVWEDIHEGLVVVALADTIRVMDVLCRTAANFLAKEKSQREQHEA